MSAPLISVILPTYNRAHVLLQAINSVLRQSHRNLELIVVDDNSPDNTAEVVANFSDSRIHYVRNEPNLKLPRALNRGFALSRGDYLTWTSDDNLYAPNALEKMLAALQQSNAQFAYADYYQFSKTDADGKPLDPACIKQPSQLQLHQGNHIGACFLYTRKLYETIGDYDPELFLVEDYDYFIRAAKQFEFIHIPEPLYYFRRDDDTLYYSRFAEVKASDILVRYKNQLIDAGQAITILAGLIMRDPRQLKSPFMRLALGLKPLPYRLSSALKNHCENQVRNHLSQYIIPALNEFRMAKLTFAEAKTNLMEGINAIAELRPQ